MLRGERSPGQHEYRRRRVLAMWKRTFENGHHIASVKAL